MSGKAKQAWSWGGGIVGLLASAMAAAQPGPPDQRDEEPIGSQQQPIVSDTVVSVAQQRELGLVTVAGGCSGILLNRYWVLTADHCLTTDNEVGGPERPLDRVPITAAWAPQVAIDPAPNFRTPRSPVENGLSGLFQKPSIVVG